MLNYKCKKCGKVFDTLSGVNMHNMRVHKGEKLSYTTTKEKAQPRYSKPREPKTPKSPVGGDIEILVPVTLRLKVSLQDILPIIDK